MDPDRGRDAKGLGLLKLQIDGGAPIQLVAGRALHPIWSPDGNLVVYTGANVSSLAPLLAIRPDGTPAELPRIQVRRDGRGSRARSTCRGSCSRRIFGSWI